MAPVPQLDFEEPELPDPKPTRAAAVRPKPARARKGKPAVPAWEDVLLGVRSSGQR